MRDVSTQFGTFKRRPLGTANAATAKAVSATTAALRRRTTASNARSRLATAGAHKIQGRGTYWAKGCFKIII